ncbi:hemagglutinin repeat-containing protein [Sporomusa acidovorans]|uniref:Filamentous hemagglutinin n=1 Tax=Sporomusa acidovorans (strain ATCC 49682 / DSM 3132 / Mol) TaxID=1123286 RepID=A0ABZ3J597_SPOA4|nr:hemagglutinin repeat-containing protein [Sporomusa acidovorans]OZC24014.1 filamentous hemagglutinin [Sporomusa acidovorans DSM 3132]SDF57329.1 Haemagluttinin repeat-containing protein [Sporomusa acidovorans]
MGLIWKPVRVAVLIDNTVNTYDSQYKYEFKQSGLTVSLGGAAVSAGLDLAGDIKRSGQVKDERLQALYGYKAVRDLKTLGKELKGNPQDGLSLNVSLGSTKLTTEQNTHTENVNASNITAGGNVNITATEGNVNLKATNINAKDITVDAKKDINIESAQNKMDSDTKTSSSSAAISASFGLSTGSFGGLTGSANSGKGKENQSATTNTESQLNASGTATLKSGNDTNIIGSQVKGKKVEVDAGHNLNIESRQDSDTYTAKNQSAGIGFGTGKISGTNGSISAGKTKSNYDSVTEQAGIFAGKDGFDIKVGKNTDLKGAVISSEAGPDKNKLSTDTLTYSDIENKAEYSASSSGIGYAAGKDANGDPVAKKDLGLIPNIGTTASGEASSTTKSAISLGTIDIRSNPNQDLSNLSRTPEGAVNALGKIFDKKTVQEQQELAKVFGEVAFKAIGDLGLKEGSPEKVLLDGVVSGIMSKLGGGSFAEGAAAGGFNQLVVNELKKIGDPALMQWASAVLGAAAAKVVGGNAQTGASIATSETKNNSLSHDEYALMEKELKNCKNEEERKAVLEKWGKLSQERDETINQLYAEYEKATTDEEREAINKKRDQLYAEWGISDGIGVTLVIEKANPDSRYEGLSKERQETLSKVDNATNLADKLKYSAQFISQGLIEKITNYRDSQYNLAINNGLTPELAAIAADNATWNLIGPALSTAVRTGDVLGSGLGNLLSKGPSKAGVEWSFRNIPEGGATITGRKYSEHALERMAPNTPEIRAELRTKADKIAGEKGLVPGSKEYNEFINKYVDPRGITPTVVEDAIRNTKPAPGNTPGTFVHENANVRVIVNSNGDVVTVIPR